MIGHKMATALPAVLPLTDFCFLKHGNIFRTRSDAHGVGRISIDALDGPLRYLSAVWNFESRDEYHTQLQFSVDYEFNNPVLAAVASRVFGAMFGEILNAFERRAAHLFTNRTSAGSTRGG